MRIFQTEWFVRFARKEKIEVARLREAIIRAERGNVDADLGGNLIKQRIARRGEGRSGGFRTLIAFHNQTRSIFLYGFAKNEKENIDEEELDSLKKLAIRLLSFSESELEQALTAKELIEVLYGNKT